MELENLVNEAKNGNKEAYSELIQLVYDDLYKIAISELHNEHDAQDAMQNAFLNAYLSINKLNNNKYFKTWITRILINECKHFYSNHKKHSEVLDKCIVSDRHTYDLDDNLAFQDMIESLDETQKKIFSLYYDDCLSIKEISNLLGINENTIKTALHRGRTKIKKSYKPATMLILVLCLLITTTVIAVSIISYIKSLFDISSIGIDNHGIVSAIEHLDWFQETNMNHIDMGNGYKIKVEYLVMDEMNLYMVFDLISENDISKVTDMYFRDLKIENENGIVIYDETDILSQNNVTYMSAKFIEGNKNNAKVLIYIYAYSFPDTKTLNISFSELSLLSKPLFGNNQFTDITSNLNIEMKIDMAEKFVNRNYTSYTCNDDSIEKAIITKTGFYAIIELNNSISPSNAYLIDEAGNRYSCFIASISFDTNSYLFKYMISTDFTDAESENLRLVIDNKEYELKTAKK